MLYYASKPGANPEAKRAHKRYIALVDGVSEQDNHYASQETWWNMENSKLGYRKHLTSRTHAFQPVAMKERIEQLRNVLVPKLRQRLMTIPPEQRDRPYPIPLSEIGYTSRPYTRRTEHSTHSSTTWAFALFEEIAVIEFPQKTYQWRYAPIAECRYEEDHCSWLECFFSRLCQSYFWLGGFNPAVAGISVKGWEKITKEVSVARLNDMDYDQIRVNIASDDRKLKAWVKYKRYGKKLQEARATIAELGPKLEELNAEKEALEERLAELREQVKRKVERELEQMVAIVDEAIETLELEDLLHQYNDALEEEIARRDGSL